MGEEFSEVPSQPEIPNTAKVFEHLFPGNKYDDLPIYPRNLKLFIDWYICREDWLHIKLLEAHNRKQKYAEREDLKPVDKLTAVYKLRDLNPIQSTARGCQILNHSFGDLIELTQDEKIGGAASRLVSWYRSRLVTKLSVKWGGNPYITEEEIIIGVLAKDGRPKAIIHYMDGEHPRVRKEVLEKNPSTNLIPSPSVFTT